MFRLALRLMIIGIALLAFALLSTPPANAGGPPDPVPGVSLGNPGDTKGKGPQLVGKRPLKDSTQSAAATAATGTVIANGANTADGNWTYKTGFRVGETIRYVGWVYNGTGITQSIYVWWYRSTPCGSSYIWQGWMNAPAGNPGWYVESTTSCPGTHTFTFWVYYNGVYTSRSITYTVASKKVVLDPGHGWCAPGWTPGPYCRVDPGAVGNGMQEKDVSLDIANRTKSILQGRGVQVFMTRTGNDPYHSLSYASQYVNQINPDLSVSIHENAGGGTGTEACYQDYKSTTAQSKDISQRLTNMLAARFSFPNRGIFSEYNTGRCGRGYQLYIHDMVPTATLIETAFIDNATDANKLLYRRQDFAQAIADAIAGYLGVP